MMNQALRNNVHIGATVGIRPSPPVKDPYERNENKIIRPLCPATNQFLDDCPLENDIQVDAALMEKFLITDSSTQVVLLYHSLSKIISNISKYGFSRKTYKEMLLYILSSPSCRT